MKQSTTTPTTPTTPTNRQPTVKAPPVVAPHRPSVSQSTLASILKDRREVKEAEESLKALKDALGERERSLIEAIEGSSTWPKANVVTGILAAEVSYTYRRNVAWKGVALEYLGEDFCEIVTEETEATVYPKLVVA